MQQQQQQAHWPPPLHLLQQLALQETQQQQQQQQQRQQGRGLLSRDQLGPDQLRALDAVMEGSCIFLTGGAGVGKSATVAVVVDDLSNSGRRVAVTASTGTAAVNVGGVTLHSFTGIREHNKPKVKLAESLWCWAKFKESWCKTDALLVDEVSMVDCELLEKVDYVARYLRGWRIQLPSLPGLQGIKEVHELHPEPFGGLQLIAVGDFHQLPPVIKPEERYLDPASPQHNSGSTPNRRSSGGRTPAQGGDRSATSSGVRRNAGSGGGSAQKKRKATQPEELDSDDEEAPPKVPVIMAALPPGFVTFTAAERAEWSARARAQAAARAAAAAAAATDDGAAAGSSIGGGSSMGPAAAPAPAGYPTVDALAGSDFINPLLQQQVALQQQQQQQSQHADVDMQGSPCKKLCRPGSIKQAAVGDNTNTQMCAQPIQQQPQQQQQGVDAGSKLPFSGDLLQPAAAEGAAVLSPQQQQLQPLLQRMTQHLTSQQLCALGIPPARNPARQLPADVQQMLASRKDLFSDQPLLGKSRDLGLQMLLLGQTGAAAAADGDAGGAGNGGASRRGFAASAGTKPAVTKVEQGVPEQDAMQEVDDDDAADDDADEWAALLEAEAALQQQQQQQGRSRGNAATVAAAATVPLPGDEADKNEVLPTLHVGSPAAAAAAAAAGYPSRYAETGQAVAAHAAADDTSSDTAGASGASCAAAAVADASQGTSGAAAAASDGVPAPSGLLRLSLGSQHSAQPAPLRPEPAAAAAAGDEDWEFVDVFEPGEAAGKDVVVLAAADSDSDEVFVNLSVEHCSQPDCKIRQQHGVPDSSAGAASVGVKTPAKPKQQQHVAAGNAAAAAAGGAIATPVKPKLEQQQHHAAAGNAAAAEAGGAIATPVKPKLEQQQHAAAGNAGAAAAGRGIVTPVKPKLEQQQHHVPAPPSALQLAAAATAAAVAAAAAAAQHSPGATYARQKVLGRELGYAESGGFPFWRIPSGNVYAEDNTMSPASVHISVSVTFSTSSAGSGGLGAAAGQQQLPTGMLPLRPGLTSGSPAIGGPGNAGGDEAGSSSSSVRPVLPQWREAPWPRAYCFKSPAWAAVGFKPVVLRQPFRQNEPELLCMLDEVRQGLFSAQTRQMLTDLQRPLSTDDGIEPTELFPKNSLVDNKNEEAYAKLTGPELKLRCIDRCRWFDADRVADPDPGLLPADWVTQSLDDSTNAQQQLKVKPLAQVVLLWNLDVQGGLANGTRGVVERFARVTEYLEQEGLVLLYARQQQQQYGAAAWQQGGSSSWPNQQQQPSLLHQQHWGAPPPLQQQGWQQQQQPVTPTPPPAGALPRYTDQQPQTGRCGDPLCPCSQGCWGKQQPGERWVRLPEAPQGMMIEIPEGMPPWRRRQLQEALVWINHTGTLQLPLVKFQLPPREASNPFAVPRRLIVGPQTYSLTRRVRVGRDSEKLRLTRTALPLRLAWALTVHRSQGMSVSKLKVHLHQSFVAGMVYVGLSRCTSLAGLQVVGEVKPPQCDEDVKRFYKYIEAEEAWLAAQGN